MVVRQAYVIGSSWQVLVVVLAALLQASCREKPRQDRIAEKVDVANSPPRQPSPAAKMPNASSDGEVDPASHTDDSESSKIPMLGLGYVDVSEDVADDSDTGVVRIDRRRSYPGYNLIEIVKHRRAELIDAAGRLINVWSHGESGQWERCVLLPDGDLLVLSFTQPHFLLRLTWNNEVVWKRDGQWHHDMVPRPDGTIAALRWEYRRIPPIHPNIDVMDNLVTRFDPNGRLEEHRSLYDIMSSKPDLITLQEGRRHDEEGGKKERIDLIHANSLNWIAPAHPPIDSPIFKEGNVIVCCRHQDSAIIFNWETSELLWAWGQGELDGPHDAQMLDNGNILVFDNGRENKRSRVLEVDPLSRKIVWQYAAPQPEDFYSTARGANQRLPNGNTLITESNRGRVFEITPAGEIVWEYFNPHRDSRNRIAAINRCYRYEADVVEPLIRSSKH